MSPVQPPSNGAQKFVTVMSDLHELFRIYSKHGSEDADDDVCKACNHLVRTFKVAMNEPDPLAAFVNQLKDDASYSSWEPEEPST